MDSDENNNEEFICLDDFIDNNIMKIYQLQINNNELIIKHIANGSKIPDIIIKENFGKNNNLNLYNCLYAQEDLNNINSDLFIPIIKLINQTENNKEFYSISIKFQISTIIQFNKILNDFELYFTYGNDDKIFNYYKIEKNIHKANIIEKLLENVIMVGKKIL